MKNLAVIWHSLTGGTAMMVEAVMAGAEEEAETRLVVKRAAVAGPDDLLAADGYIFACPENLASMAGVMKDFFDRAYYPALEQIQGRPYAMMVCAGSDGEGTARQIARIATGWRLKAIAEPLIVVTHAQAPTDIFSPKMIPAADLERCRTLGRTMAAGLAMGVF